MMFPVQVKFERTRDGSWSALAPALNLMVSHHETLESALDELAVGIVQEFEREFQIGEPACNHITEVVGRATVALWSPQDTDLSQFDLRFDLEEECAEAID